RGSHQEGTARGAAGSGPARHPTPQARQGRGGRPVSLGRLADGSTEARPHNMTEETILLYRPVGPAELELIRESGYRVFPPRLPHQPIFYPVLNEEYATQIARDWNVPDSGAGYVTRFHVRANFLKYYEVHTV